MDKRVRTGLRIPYSLNTELILEAQEIGISKNALILQILTDWARKKKKEEQDGKVQRTDNAPPASRVEREAAGRGGANGN